MKQWLKISALVLILFAMVGCRKANQESKEPTEGKEPYNQVEGVTGAVKDSEFTLPQDAPTQGVEPQGDQAKNVIIALDAGHGGKFGGASHSGMVEKDLTLKMANYVKEYLENHYTGMEVYLVRNEDISLSNDVKEDLELRAEFAKNVGADVLVSLHFNASEEHTQKGAMILVSHRENVTERSKELGSLILKEIESLGIKNNGNVTRNSNDLFDDAGKPLDYYAINRHCAARDIPGIIVEHCYMDNANDQQYIDSEEDLRALAKADAVGIAKYFGLATK